MIPLEKNNKMANGGEETMAEVSEAALQRLEEERRKLNPNPTEIRMAVERAKTDTASVNRVRELLGSKLRVETTDGRVFIGTFVGIDDGMNVIMTGVEVSIPLASGKICTQYFPNALFKKQWIASIESA